MEQDAQQRDAYFVTKLRDRLNIQNHSHRLQTKTKCQPLITEVCHGRCVEEDVAQIRRAAPTFDGTHFVLKSGIHKHQFCLSQKHKRTK